ncbi:MAG: 3'-5' exonuclease domain-containing protein 2 [Bacteroidales bacterium]|nr:3'-5' exonuclease domain-containing protein 2 [Bacteroidales bacterium]
MFKISIAPEEIENMPLGSFPGEIHVISKAGREYNRAIAYLRAQKMIGFDTETRPVFEPHKPHNHVALLQLSGPDHAFLFRINLLGMRKRLWALLADKEIIKIGAACHDDVRGLKHYGDFKEQGFIDLQKIGWEWGIKDKSVKKMAANILGVRISKAQQLSNWEAEQLSDSQKMYAATDAWVCLEMYKKLLESPKNPLTPEQLAPNPPKNDQDNTKAQA